MARKSIQDMIKNAWEYKRAALLWTVLSVMVFVPICVLFLQYTDTYLSAENMKALLQDGQSDLIRVLLDNYVVTVLLLLGFVFTAYSFLSQLWNDDIADYYILLLMWSLLFYILYSLNLFNAGHGALPYIIDTLADTLYQLSAVPLLLCLYMRTERYRGFLRTVLVIEYVLCTLFALLSVTGLFPAVLAYVTFVSDLLLCCALAGILVLGYTEAKQGNRFYRLFCPLVSVLVLGMVVVTLIAVLNENSGLYLQRIAFYKLVQE